MENRFHGKIFLKIFKTFFSCGTKLKGFTLFEQGREAGGYMRVAQDEPLIEIVEF